ncbi:MAG TPA: NAD(P)H-dependent oxidoreductase [Bryobacteraceae bacterium]|nr:NAD(P)H-dependent oxidoreductase [Bryobacteraceae bacterium]
MEKPLSILGIAGSLRKTSFNRGLLRAAQQLAPPGVTIESFDLEGIPVFNQDLDGNPPPRVTDFKARIRAADAILIATPEYNYSIPGVLKNAIDWASRPYGDNSWDEKPVALMGASGGIQGTSRAQYHFRQCFVFLNMYPLNKPEVMIASAAQKFDGDGNLTDEKGKEMVSRLIAALADWTRKLKGTSVVMQSTAP